MGKIALNEWLFSGLRADDLNVREGRFWYDPAFSRGIGFRECPGWEG